VASHLGYWRQEGLDVEVAGLAGMSSSIQSLLLGKADIAAVAPDTVLAAADQGRPLAVTPFYTWIRKSKVAVIVPADSPITSLGQLKGKVVGVTTLADSNTTVTKSMLAGAEGLPAAELHILPVGLGAPAGEALASGKIAAYSGADSRAAQLVGLGYKVRYLPIPVKYQNIATHLAAAPAAEEQSGLDQGPGASLGRGRLLQAERRRVLRINWKVIPRPSPRPGTDSLHHPGPHRAGGAPAEYYADDGKWGETHADYWLNLAQALGLTKFKSAQDVSRLFTNQFVADFGKFDEAAIVKQASNYK
jgi:NitT/TauT family transport system substrate-binding protein